MPSKTGQSFSPICMRTPQISDTALPFVVNNHITHASCLGAFDPQDALRVAGLGLTLPTLWLDISSRMLSIFSGLCKTQNASTKCWRCRTEIVARQSSELQSSELQSSERQSSAFSACKILGGDANQTIS
eukprot:2268659-Rhodomonas_salina.1